MGFIKTDIDCMVERLVVDATGRRLSIFDRSGWQQLPPQHVDWEDALVLNPTAFSSGPTIKQILIDKAELQCEAPPAASTSRSHC